MKACDSFAFHPFPRSLKAKHTLASSKQTVFIPTLFILSLFSLLPSSWLGKQWAGAASCRRGGCWGAVIFRLVHVSSISVELTIVLRYRDVQLNLSLFLLSLSRLSSLVSLSFSFSFSSLALLFFFFFFFFFLFFSRFLVAAARKYRPLRCEIYSRNVARPGEKREGREKKKNKKKNLKERIDGGFFVCKFPGFLTG